MTLQEWLECKKPDDLLQFLLGRVSNEQLIQFVRECWNRITPYLDAPPHEVTVVEQFAEAVGQMSDMDAATYAYEASFKAAGWAPDMLKEQAAQAEVLKCIVAYPEKIMRIG